MAESHTLWGLDPSIVVHQTPLHESGPQKEPLWTISSPTAFGVIHASAYQLQLLWSLQTPDSFEALLARYPFEKDSSHTFLERCRSAGFVRRADPETSVVDAPDRVPALPRFMGAPFFEPERAAAFTVLGIPFDGNTTGFPGTRFGPPAIRDASEGIRYTLDPVTQVPVGFYDYGSQRSLLPGVTVADAGDVYVSPGEDGPEAYSRITDVVQDLLEVGTIPMVIGGDHSITLPVLNAFPPTPMQIVHLDAHTDLGSKERSDATALHHGNVFSLVLDNLPHVVHLRQLGLRGIIEAGATSDHTRCRAVGMDQLRASGPDAALEDLSPSLPTYISLDIDVVDPTFAGSTGTPVPNGLYPHELKNLLRKIAEKCRVVGMDVVEVIRPTHPADGTAYLAVEAIITTADAICERMLADTKNAGA